MKFATLALATLISAPVLATEKAGASSQVQVLSREPMTIAHVETPDSAGTNGRDSAKVIEREPMAIAHVETPDSAGHNGGEKA